MALVYKKILPNQRFGKLVTIKKVDNYCEGNYYWDCICDCGNTKVAFTGGLNSGGIKSCGCVRIEKITKHGQAKLKKRTSEYTSWLCMIHRCYSLNVDGYELYGGKGIKVCDRWRYNFKNFFEDMGLKPTKKHTIERDDILGNYEPSNCRWATPQEQAVNKSNNVWIEHNGIKMVSAHWAKKLNISRGRFRLYYKKHGIDKTINYYNGLNGN